MKVLKVLLETKIYLLILSSIGLCYIASLNKLCLRFVDSWIMVLAYQFLILFLYFSLKRKYGGKSWKEKN